MSKQSYDTTESGTNYQSFLVCSYLYYNDMKPDISTSGRQYSLVYSTESKKNFLFFRRELSITMCRETSHARFPRLQK